MTSTALVNFVVAVAAFAGEPDSFIPVEAKVNIDGWDTFCSNSDLGKAGVVACEAYRAIQGAMVRVKYKKEGYVVTILSTDCSAQDHAVQSFSPLTPLSIALPYTLNKYDGRCSMPKVTQLPKGVTGQLENLMYLMVAQR